jgi:uncharacterized coiled-coil protein SlyX
MPVTDQDFADLKARVGRLEKASVTNTETIKWMAGELGTVRAIVDTHTVRLDRIDDRLERVEDRLDSIEGRMGSLEAKVDALPRVLAETMREFMTSAKA